MSDGISILVYGRNDNHGYNLQRRAALSLNAMAHVLNDADEILFCDCNTPDALPTFPEAIADTLTDRAKRLLRVIRVRPRAYARLMPRCQLPVCEPFCRNVLLRRSDPARRWVLSTNTDMIFRPLAGDSLKAAIENLEDALYIAPRFELPEICWESLDRRDPAAALELVRRWGSTLSLDHFIRVEQPIVFDGPGDFQLLPRNMAFALDGFDESIVGGWHVDGNFCKRAALANGRNRSLHERVWGYHCDHNRSASHTHSSTAHSGNYRALTQDVHAANLPAQRASWGAPAETFEAFALDAKRMQWTVLEQMLPAQSTPSSEGLDATTVNLGVQPDLRLVLPHLTSHLLPRGPRLRIGYLGFNPALLTGLREWAGRTAVQIEFISAPVCRTALGPEVTQASIWEELPTLDVIILDADPGRDAPLPLAGENPTARKDVLGERSRQLLATLHPLAKQLKLLGDAGPQLLALNTQNSWLERALSKKFNLTLAPFASRVRPAAVIVAKPKLRALRRLLRRK